MTRNGFLRKVYDAEMFGVAAFCFIPTFFYALYKLIRGDDW